MSAVEWRGLRDRQKVDDGFVLDDKKVEEKWKFCTRIRILLSLVVLEVRGLKHQFCWVYRSGFFLFNSEA